MKKRLNKNQNSGGDTKDTKQTTHEDKESVVVDTTSLQQSSNSTATFDITNSIKDDIMSYEDISALVDESFWSDVVSVENSNDNEKTIEDWEGLIDRNSKIYSYNNSKLYDDDMEFWFDLLTSSRRIEAFSDIPEF